MFNYSKDGITVASILDTRKMNVRGNYPIKIRVGYKRDRKYYPTGKELTENEWESLPTKKSKEFKIIRESIENSFSLVKSNVEILAEKGNFSFDTLNLRLSKTTGDSLNMAFKIKIENLLKEDRIGSKLVCQNVLNNIELFTGSNVYFESITVDLTNE